MIMKRNRICLLSVLSALMMTLSGCDEEIVCPVQDNAQAEKVTFMFHPDFGEDEGAATKALTEKPDVRNIYFAVFDAVGYKLSEYAEAVPNTLATENGEPYYYSIELSVTNEPRVVHIIANAPGHINFGAEAEVIGSLYTMYNASETETSGFHDRKDAYWARISLPNGVAAAPDEEIRLSNPDAYAAQNSKYMNLVNQLDGIKLIRNFGKFTVRNSASNFTLTGFWLTNFPDRGTVAPYNRNTGAFQTEYFNTNIDDIVNKGQYEGFFAAGTQVVDITDWSDEQIEAARIAPEQFAYCYEREVPKQNPLYIIIAGKYNGDSKETYYKIDLRDNNDKYFPIIRNFNYRINIDEVHRSGASTVRGALTAAPSGYVDTSLDLIDLLNISDGISQMFVSETDVVIVGDDPVMLRYKYIPDLAETDANGKTVFQNITKEQWEAANPGKDIEKTLVDGKHISYVTFETVSGATGPVFQENSQSITDGTKQWSVSATDDKNDDYRVVTLHPVTPDDVIKTQEILIKGHHFNTQTDSYETISRKVTYHLRKRLEMTLACDPVFVPERTSEAVDIVIGLEAGLPSSIFSLDMNIEAQGLTLTTNNDPLPVHTGETTIQGNDNPSFYYQRTITWREYQDAEIIDGYKYFRCHFKTNTYNFDKLPGSSSTKGDVIYVSNKYFTQNKTQYETFALNRTFENLVFSGYTGNPETGQTIDFNFDIVPVLPEYGNVTVGLVGFEEAPASSSYARKLSYKGVKEETFDGETRKYELYSMPVSSLTGNALKLVPFKDGSCYVRLWADKYLSVEKELEVGDGGGKLTEPDSPAGNIFSGNSYNFNNTSETYGWAMHQQNNKGSVGLSSPGYAGSNGALHLSNGSVANNDYEAQCCISVSSMTKGSYQISFYAKSGKSGSLITMGGQHMPWSQNNPELTVGTFSLTQEWTLYTKTFNLDFEGNDIGVNTLYINFGKTVDDIYLDCISIVKLSGPSQPSPSGNIIDENSYNFNNNSLNSWRKGGSKVNNTAFVVDVASPGSDGSGYCMHAYSPENTNYYAYQSIFEHNFVNGHTYRIAFMARSNNGSGKIDVCIQDGNGTKGDYGPEFNIGTSWSSYQCDIKVSNDGLTSLKLSFGSAQGDYYLDTISLIDLGTGN